MSLRKDAVGAVAVVMVFSAAMASAQERPWRDDTFPKFSIREALHFGPGEVRPIKVDSQNNPSLLGGVPTAVGQPVTDIRLFRRRFADAKYDGWNEGSAIADSNGTFQSDIGPDGRRRVIMMETEQVKISFLLSGKIMTETE